MWCASTGSAAKRYVHSTGSACGSTAGSSCRWSGRRVRAKAPCCICSARWTPPIPGSIAFDGDEIGRLSDEQQSQFRHHRVGFIFQFFNLLPTLSAWENVAVPKLLDGVRLGKAKPDAIRLLERVGLGNRTEHRPAELSGGQMQRVAVARALMMDPPLILADEPTGNLDSTTGASILALLGEVAHEDGRGRLVVMVTHNSEAAEATDRVITLQDGRVGSDELSVVSR